MSMGVMRVLSQCGEEEFDKTIHEMPIAVSYLGRCIFKDTVYLYRVDPMYLDV